MTTHYTRENAKFPSPSELNRRLELAERRRMPLRQRIAALLARITKKPADHVARAKE